MKKYILLLSVVLGFSFYSCQEEVEPGGTAVEEMAGDWWVTYQNSEEEAAFIFDGVGAMPLESDIENWTWSDTDTHYRLSTFNTASNVADSMFLQDDGNADGPYWDYKLKVGANYSMKSFQCDSTSNLAYDSGIKVIGGKIIKGAATSPSGMPVDSIVFYIRFYDDQDGFTYTKASGFRRTGFEADDF